MLRGNYKTVWPCHVFAEMKKSTSFPCMQNKCIKPFHDTREVGVAFSDFPPSPFRLILIIHAKTSYSKTHPIPPRKKKLPPPLIIKRGSGKRQIAAKWVWESKLKKVFPDQEKVYDGTVARGR